MTANSDKVDVLHQSEAGRRITTSTSSHHVEMSTFVGQESSSSTSTTTTKHVKRPQDRSTNPSLWNTKEFYFYYFVFITCIPYMFKTAHDASSRKFTLSPV